MAGIHWLSCCRGPYVYDTGKYESCVVCDYAPSVRGAGFAISALTQGIALGAGNYMAGRLCDIFGSAGAFWGGGAFATAALGLGWLLL